MCHKELEENEAKEYASKNIMLNVHSIFRETVRTFEEHPLLKGKINFEEFINDFVMQVDNMLNNILINLADNYPQAPPSGGTLRMREVITEVNRNDDSKNDFIHTSGIKISDYLTVEKQTDKKGRMVEILKLEEDSANYTGFIMQVINAAIEVSQDNRDDPKERTNFALFSEFGQQLCWLTQQKEYQHILTSISMPGIAREEKQAKIDGICDYFDEIFGSSPQKKAQKADNETSAKLR
jgi:hypothetical protein